MIPLACILPAARITRSPSSRRYNSRVSVMAALVTPIPGLPVSRMKSTPISTANLAFSRVAFLPSVMAHMFSSGSVEARLCSTGSKLMPTGLPVSFFSVRTTSWGGHLGRPRITGFWASNRFSKIMSAPMAATNSALVISPSIGWIAPMVSQARVRPSPWAMA